MAKKSDIHVVPHGEKWATRREGADRVSSTHRTQSEAQKAARERAIRDNVGVVTHRPDGRIRDSDSYGNDPNPPKDKKH
jgi:predicted NUDIX family NTP pyrophosphohydrolase